MSDNDEMASSAVLGSLFTEPEPVSEEVKALAERRLSQIVAVLGLHPNAFEIAFEEALKAADGAHDRILSQQVRGVNDALLAIEDPIIRQRIAGLLTALAETKPH